MQARVSDLSHQKMVPTICSSIIQRLRWKAMQPLTKTKACRMKSGKARKAHVQITYNLHNHLRCLEFQRLCFGRAFFIVTPQVDLSHRFWQVRSSKWRLTCGYERVLGRMHWLAMRAVLGVRMPVIPECVFIAICLQLY